MNPTIEQIDLFHQLLRELNDDIKLRPEQMRQVQTLMQVSKLLEQTIKSSDLTTNPTPPSTTIHQAIERVLHHFWLKAETIEEKECLAHCTTLLQTQLQRPFTPAPPGCGIQEWLASDESSAATRWLLAATHPNHPELDPYRETLCFPNNAEDVLRCLVLMKAVPTVTVDKVDRKTCGPIWNYILDNLQQINNDAQKSLTTVTDEIHEVIHHARTSRIPPN